MVRSPRRLLGCLLLGTLTSLCLAAAESSSAPYTFRNVQIRGGGFVTGLVFHPTERGLRYARTDVGGAYRWDAASARWIPITDWLGMDDAHLTGIDGLALDPADPDRVYLAAGIYNRPEMPNAALLRSADRGATWSRVGSFPAVATAPAADSGDPQRPQMVGIVWILFDSRGGTAGQPTPTLYAAVSTRETALFRSTDAGATWLPVPG